VITSCAFDMADLLGVTRCQLCRETAANYVLKPDTAPATRRLATLKASCSQWSSGAVGLGEGGRPSIRRSSPVNAGLGGLTQLETLRIDRSGLHLSPCGPVGLNELQ
jgi:hypothetical protein